jgi:hypothetical protein
MKSCSKYTEVFNIKNKTLLITIIFVALIIILYLVYKPSSDTNNITTNNLNSINNVNNQSNIKQNINNLLNKGSELLNNQYNDTFKDTPTPIPYNDLTKEQQEIVKSHRTFFNKATKDEITKFTSKYSDSVDTNLTILVNRYNDYSNEVNNTIEEINYDLLRQLQRNYALAHKVNVERNIDLEDIDSLPQRFD